MNYLANICAGLALAAASAVNAQETTTLSSQPAATAAPATQPAPTVAPATAPPTTAEAPLVGYVALDRRPVMSDMTTGKAAFGVVGALTMVPAGEAILKDNDVQSPAPGMAKDIAAAFAASHGYLLAQTPVLPAEKAAKDAPPVALLTTDGSKPDYLVAVSTPSLMLMYFSFDWVHYDLRFMAGAVIVENATKKRIATATCSIPARKTEPLKSHDELLADKAAGLKALILSKAAECTAQLKEKMGLAPGPTSTAAASP